MEIPLGKRLTDGSLSRAAQPGPPGPGPVRPPAAPGASRTTTRSTRPIHGGHGRRGKLREPGRAAGGGWRSESNGELLSAQQHSVECGHDGDGSVVHVLRGKAGQAPGNIDHPGAAR